MPNGQGYTVTFAGIASTSIPEFICHSVDRMMVGERRHAPTAIAGREGSWLFPQPPGDKLITVHASILADTYPVERQDVVRSVGTWLNSTTPQKLIISDEPGVFNKALLNTAPLVESWREKATFDLEFLAEPYLQDVSISDDTEVASSAVDTFNIPTLGTVRTYPVITITTSGAANNWVFSMNGNTLTFGASIAASTSFTINCISHTVTIDSGVDTDLTGLFNPANLFMTAVGGLFPYLLPNTTNVLSVSASASGYTVDVKWRNRWH